MLSYQLRFFFEQCYGCSRFKDMDERTDELVVLLQDHDELISAAYVARELEGDEAPSLN